MHPIQLFQALVWLPICLAASLKPDVRASLCPKSLNAEIKVLKAAVHQPQQWCSFWDATTKGTSPFATLTVAQMNSVCKCIVFDPSIVGPLVTMNPKQQKSSIEYLNTLESSVAAPLDFCKWWPKSSRKTTPFNSLSVPHISSICKHVDATPAILKPTTIKPTTKVIPTTTSKTSSTTPIKSATSKPSSATSKPSSASTNSGKTATTSHTTSASAHPGTSIGPNTSKTSSVASGSLSRTTSSTSTSSTTSLTKSATLTTTSAATVGASVCQTNLVVNPSFTATSAPWTSARPAAIEACDNSYYSCPGSGYISINEDTTSGYDTNSKTANTTAWVGQVITGLKVGATYQFGLNISLVNAGSTCTVSYMLGNQVIRQYSLPTNVRERSETWDGWYPVVATSASAGLNITMQCSPTGGTNQLTFTVPQLVLNGSVSCNTTSQQPTTTTTSTSSHVTSQTSQQPSKTTTAPFNYVTNPAFTSSAAPWGSSSALKGAAAVDYCDPAHQSAYTQYYYCPGHGSLELSPYDSTNKTTKNQTGTIYQTVNNLTVGATYDFGLEVQTHSQDPYYPDSLCTVTYALGGQTFRQYDYKNITAGAYLWDGSYPVVATSTNPVLNISMTCSPRGGVGYLIFTNVTLNLNSSVALMSNNTFRF